MSVAYTDELRQEDNHYNAKLRAGKRRIGVKLPKIIVDVKDRMKIIEGNKKKKAFEENYRLLSMEDIEAKMNEEGALSDVECAILFPEYYWSIFYHKDGEVEEYLKSLPARQARRRKLEF